MTDFTSTLQSTEPLLHCTYVSLPITALIKESHFKQYHTVSNVGTLVKIYFV